jgi:cytochrome c biogenesis protein CcdA
MDGQELSWVAAFVGGVLTSASPCTLAAVPVAVGFVGGQAQSPRRAWALSTAFVAGMTLSLTVLGLMAARLGTLMGTLPGMWTALAGVLFMAMGVWLWSGQSASFQLPLAWQQRFAGSGLWGSAALGGLLGTVMSPCATPALAAALALAGTGSLQDGSVWQGAALLAAYGVGHSALLWVAGAMPATAMRWGERMGAWQAWLPGRRLFAALLVPAGAWWVWQSIL